MIVLVGMVISFYTLQKRIAHMGRYIQEHNTALTLLIANINPLVWNVICIRHLVYFIVRYNN